MKSKTFFFFLIYRSFDQVWPVNVLWGSVLVHLNSSVFFFSLLGQRRKDGLEINSGIPNRSEKPRTWKCGRMNGLPSIETVPQCRSCFIRFTAETFFCKPEKTTERAYVYLNVQTQEGWGDGSRGTNRAGLDPALTGGEALDTFDRPFVLSLIICLHHSSSTWPKVIELPNIYLLTTWFLKGVNFFRTAALKIRSSRAAFPHDVQSLQTHTHTQRRK